VGEDISSLKTIISWRSLEEERSLVLISLLCYIVLEGIMLGGFVLISLKR
jgi:ABC-type lipoprotein release transport system permease subunit